MFDNSINRIWLIFFAKAKPFGTGKILIATYFVILFDIRDRPWVVIIEKIRTIQHSLWNICVGTPKIIETPFYCFVFLIFSKLLFWTTLLVIHLYSFASVSFLFSFIFHSFTQFLIMLVSMKYFMLRFSLHFHRLLFLWNFH